MTTSTFPSARRRSSLVAIAVISTLSSSWALAQDATTGSYVGGNVGATRAHFDNDSLNRTLAGQGFNVRSATEDNSSTGYKVFGGYQLNRNFAVEGGYFDLGKFQYGLRTAPVGTFNGETRVRGLNLDLVAIAPLTDRFSVFGRVGAAYAQSRADVVRTGFLPLNNIDTRSNKTNLKLGLGLQYAITEALSLRAELERYRINDPVRNRGHIDMASVGLVYRFGGKVQTPVRQTAFVPVAMPSPPPPAPPVMAPPPPAPAPVMAAPAPMPQPAFVPPVRPAKQGRN